MRENYIIKVTLTFWSTKTLGLQSPGAKRGIYTKHSQHPDPSGEVEGETHKSSGFTPSRGRALSSPPLGGRFD